MTTDRRSLSDVASIVKKSNSKLAELKSELHELESQILLTKGNTVSNGQGELQSDFSVSLFFVSIIFCRDCYISNCCFKCAHKLNSSQMWLIYVKEKHT